MAALVHHAAHCCELHCQAFVLQVPIAHLSESPPSRLIIAIHSIQFSKIACFVLFAHQPGPGAAYYPRPTTTGVHHEPGTRPPSGYL
jgi:hypothetical protein